MIPQSVHTISQTREWLIVADCAYKVEPQVLSGGARTEPANHSGPVYLIRKADLTVDHLIVGGGWSAAV